MIFYTFHNRLHFISSLIRNSSVIRSDIINRYSHELHLICSILFYSYLHVAQHLLRTLINVDFASRSQGFDQKFLFTQKLCMERKSTTEYEMYAMTSQREIRLKIM